MRVGPYAVVEGPAEIGENCVMEAHATLTGAVRLGRGVRVGHGAVLGGWPQDFAFDPATASGVEVGDGSQIREHCTIHRGTTPGTVTRLGARCLLMAGAHLGHNARVGDHVVIANHVLLGGYVEIGDRVFIGGGSVFHQFVRVGRGAMIQGLSAFSKDVPPFTLAAERNLVFGLNVVGLRRAGFPAGGARGDQGSVQAALCKRTERIPGVGGGGGEGVGRAAAAEFFAFAAAAKKRGLCAFQQRPKRKFRTLWRRPRHVHPEFSAWIAGRPRPLTSAAHMNIFVTGGAGYIGSICVEQLLDRGHGVTVFDNLTEGHRLAVDPRAAFIEGDLNDPRPSAPRSPASSPMPSCTSPPTRWSASP